MTKKRIILTIFSMIFIFIGLFLFKNNNNIGGGYPSGENIIGTDTNMGLLPYQMYEENSTTTDSSKNQGGLVVNQLFETTKYDKVYIQAMMKGGTSTSTAYIRQLCSQDGNNYFPMASSTTNLAGSTTTINLSQTGIKLIPGISTTSFPLIGFDTFGCRYTRFLVWGDDLTTDITDGIYAWIKVIKIETIIK